MGMHEGNVVGGWRKGDTVRFRTMSGLTRQLGGNEWRVQQDDNVSRPRRTVEILKKLPGAESGWSIVSSVRVSVAAISPRF